MQWYTGEGQGDPMWLAISRGKREKVFIVIFVLFSVCVCVSVYVCVCAHVHTCMHAHTCIHMYMGVHVIHHMCESEMTTR